MVIVLPTFSQEKIDLFVAYARFEFALKDAGFVGGKKGEVAYANWHRFSREKEVQDVFEATRTDKDVGAMIATPPKYQIREGIGFQWREQFVSPLTSLTDLYLAVKAVRDNLFHGGKAGEDPRDDVLCRAGLIVIKACLDRHRAIRDIFEYKY